MSYTPIDRLKNCQAYMEQEADKIQTVVRSKCQAAIIAQLLDWKKRFPRHEFHAWEAHGLLEFEVSPPVNGERFVSYLEGARGAIGELGEEARIFIDYWHAMEYKLASSPVTDTIRIPQ